MPKLLFLDDRHIEYRQEIEFSPYRPEKHPGSPLLCGDAFMSSPDTVLYDPEERLFKLWYSTYNSRDETVLTYWISADGIGWEAPELGLHPDPELTNIVMLLGSSNLGTPRILRNDQEPDPEKRYAMIYYLLRNGQRGAGLAYSPDGKQWTVANNGDFVFRGHDAYNLMADPVTGICYCYHIQLVEKGTAAYTRYDNAPAMRRIVALKTSQDMLQWNDKGTLFEIEDGDPLDLQHYGFMVFPYEDYYIGLLSAYYTDAQAADIVFLFSRDGIRWDKRYTAFGSDSFIPRGSADQFDSEFLYPAQTMLKTGNRLYFYYCGVNRPHNWLAWYEMEMFLLRRLAEQKRWEERLGPYPVAEKESLGQLYEELENRIRARLLTERAAFQRGVGLATMREDGFVALQNRSPAPALLRTKPFVMERGLWLNADCSNGYLEAALADESGEVLPGYEQARCRIEGVDDTRIELKWNGRNAQSLNGRTVQLIVTLHGARLYAVEY